MLARRLAKVLMAPRRDKVSLSAAAGTNYLDPVSKVLSFVVKCTVAPVRIRQLDVVSVAFGVVVTFEEFFEDNFIDPNAIDSAYADKVPPTYAATYDPDNGAFWALGGWGALINTNNQFN